MEIAPELQFKHYTLREAQLPADALVQHRGGRPRQRRDLLRPRPSHVFYAEHTDPAVAAALRASHWFDLREWIERVARRRRRRSLTAPPPLRPAR